MKCWRYHSEEGINYSSFRKQPLTVLSSDKNRFQHHSTKFPVCNRLPSPNLLRSHDLWWFSSSTMDFSGPAAPRPKGPKRTRVPPKSEGTKNECNWKTGRIVRKTGNCNTRDWKKCNLQLNELNNFWCFSASERPRVFGLRWHVPRAEKRQPQTWGSKAKLLETWTCSIRQWRPNQNTRFPHIIMFDLYFNFIGSS